MPAAISAYEATLSAKFSMTGFRSPLDHSYLYTLEFASLIYPNDRYALGLCTACYTCVVTHCTCKYTVQNKKQNNKMTKTFESPDSSGLIHWKSKTTSPRAEIC